MPKAEVLKVSTLTGHRDCIYTLAKADHSNRFFSSGGDGMVVRWDLENPETGEVIAKTQNSVYALHFMPETGHLLVGENFEGLHVLNPADKKRIFSSAVTKSAVFDIKSSSKYVFVANGDGYLMVLDRKNYSTLDKIRLSEKSLRSIAVDESTGQVAVGGSDNVLRILNMNNLQLLATIDAHQNSVFTVVYSPEYRYLLTAGRDAHLKIWDVKGNYSLKTSIVAHMYAINHIAFSPDGKYFATCSMDKSIKLWDAAEFRLLKVIDKARHAGHGTSVNKLLWSSYNNLLISGSDDRTVSVWNIQFNPDEG